MKRHPSTSSLLKTYKVQMHLKQIIGHEAFEALRGNREYGNRIEKTYSNPNQYQSIHERNKNFRTDDF